MQEPRKPQTDPETRSRTIFLACLTALLLSAGWLWFQYRDKPGEVIRFEGPASAAVGDTVMSSASAVVTERGNKARPAKARPSPPATKGEKQPPDNIEKQPEQPNLVEEKPKTPANALPTCDQLVLRSGDLIDADISEIGVNEIRYKKCRWKDGPDYVLPRNEVLSIRYANGEVERL
ncbi:hypothetical protein [Spirosoma montaniterrae]|uniref:Uncharacterized protein n=1 Tax=Spirosoma montaniterrae TaxID=1178516 RepID=A0A1P9WZ60_9BACT|nr:hypothetical protein [Spirosoma montaniterrae]AQG80634.1 hypothetical protein AWR27_15660 [Spirosoma montaniterrae]